MFIMGTLFLYFPPIFIFLYCFINYCIGGKKSVCVIVLGDIGRSPRMQYHALSFVRAGFSVDVVGYAGSEVQKGLQDSDQVSLHYLREPPALLKHIPRLLAYLLKIVWQVLSLGTTLLLMPKCGHMLLQNPPCIPSLAVAWAVCWLRGGRLVVDWHNYGYTIMGLTLGQSHIVVRIAKLYERIFGRLSSQNVCVTKAMQMDLKHHWNIQASVVYDRPPEMFHSAALEDRHALFTRLAKTYPQFQRSDGCVDDSTMFTFLNEDNDPEYIQNRPALLVSSTSWTEDEDFGILLSALEKYEKVVCKRKEELPDLVCVITGKGPLKEFYKQQIEGKSWSHVSFCLPWLTPEDYPLLLGSADLGVCLHKSSSGLDLPMKVVDMFGCGLPVCAVDFKCLPELVQHGENGLIFEDSSDLFDCIKQLLKGFPDGTKTLSQFRKNLQSFQAVRWQGSWEQNVLPLFTDSASDKKNR